MLSKCPRLRRNLGSLIYQGATVLNNLGILMACMMNSEMKHLPAIKEFSGPEHIQIGPIFLFIVLDEGQWIIITLCKRAIESVLDIC